MNLKKNELRERLKEMSLTDEEREEVYRSLTNLMVRGNLLCDENDSLHLRLKVYGGFTWLLTGRFPLLTPADLQFCLLMRLCFTFHEYTGDCVYCRFARFGFATEVRLKKRLAQMDEALFANGETVDAVVGGC